jgi:hypothetical protein
MTNRKQIILRAIGIFAALIGFAIGADILLPPAEFAVEKVHPGTFQEDRIFYGVPYTGGGMDSCKVTSGSKSRFGPGSAVLITRSRILGRCSLSLLPENWGLQLPATDDILAKNRSINIGGHTISAPALFFLSSTTNTGITTHINNYGHDVEINIDTFLHKSRQDVQINAVSISSYMGSLQALQDYSTDKHVSATEALCNKLTQQWAQNQCSLGLYDMKHVFHPRHFTLIERAHLNDSRIQIAAYAGEFKTVGDAARQMLEENKFPNRNCQITELGIENSSCTYIDKIGEDLFVVWSSGKKENFPEDFHNPKEFIMKELITK